MLFRAKGLDRLVGVSVYHILKNPHRILDTCSSPAKGQGAPPPGLHPSNKNPRATGSIAG